MTNGLFGAALGISICLISLIMTESLTFYALVSVSEMCMVKVYQIVSPPL